jgi:Queuosine salvage protein
MTRSLLDDVRASCAAVAARARQVAIVAEALPAYAAALPLGTLAAPSIDPAFHVLSDEATTVAYFLTLDTINFGSGYFPLYRKRPGLSGYFNVALSLKEAFEAEGPWSAEQLSAMTPARCASVFGQDREFHLMALFATALGDLGRLLLAEYDGSPVALVRAAGGSAERLVELLAAMPYYRDVSAYEDLSVAFYKRAQLAAADLALAVRSPLTAFRDLDRLTIFADNLVPHVLRVDGVLRYAPELLARIQAEEAIGAGAPEEIEIRACALHAVELLKAEVTRRGERVTSTQLDYYLWNRGQSPPYKAQPRHRARSVYY